VGFFHHHHILVEACDAFVLTVQGSWSYNDRKDMEMLTTFATEEDFEPEESMLEYVLLEWEDWKLVRVFVRCMRN
jgi:hypothetical protein